MVVGVIAVDEMEPSIMDIVHMGSVLDHRVFFTVVTMHVIITGDLGHQFLGFGIGRSDRQRVLVNMSIMRVMQVAIVQVVDMTRVLDRRVTAPVRMAVTRMIGMEDLVRKRARGKGRGQGGKCKQACHGRLPQANGAPAIGV